MRRFEFSIGDARRLDFRRGGSGGGAEKKDSTPSHTPLTANYSTVMPEPDVPGNVDFEEV